MPQKSAATRVADRACKGIRQLARLADANGHHYNGPHPEITFLGDVIAMLDHRQKWAIERDDEAINGWKRRRATDTARKE